MAAEGERRRRRSHDPHTILSAPPLLFIVRCSLLCDVDTGVDDVDDVCVCVSVIILCAIVF